MTESNFSNYEALRRNNLIRLECEELIVENVVDPLSKIIRKAHHLTSTVENSIQNLRSVELKADLDLYKKQMPALSSNNPIFKSDKFHKGNISVCYSGDELSLLPINGFGASVEVSGAMIGMVQRAKAPLRCDVCLMLPKSWFQEKDYLNFRYFDKRNLVALHIAKQLNQKKYQKVMSVEAKFQDSHHQKLCLIVRPPIERKKAKNGKEYKSLSKSNNFEIRIVLGTDGFVFPETRYLPDRHNCRYGTNLYSKEENQATPHYNASLCEDSCYLELTTMVKEWCGDCKPFAEASVLFLIWQIQHGICEYKLNVLFLILHLCQKKHISRNMTALQIFTLMLKYIEDQFLQQANLPDLEDECKDGEIISYEDVYKMRDTGNKRILFIGTITDVFENDDVLNFFRSGAARPIFQSAYITNLVYSYNTFYRLDFGDVYQVFYSAKASLKKMNFEEMFLLKFDFYNRYDLYLHIELDRIEGNDVEFGNNASARRVTTLLHEALFGRAKVIGAQTESGALRVGVQLLNTANVGQRVTRGPSGRSEEVQTAKLFKSFWGEKKVDLRRFSDGKVVYACVWKDGNTLDVIHDICCYIIKYKVCADTSFPLGGMRNLISSADVDCAELSKRANIAFNDLQTYLERHEFEKLPIQIAKVESCSPLLRQSTLFPPQPHPMLDSPKKLDTSKVSGCTNHDPICVNLEMEHTSKWPSDAKALKATKLAFLLAIAEDLPEKKFHQVNVYSTHIDLGFQGFSFRCYINLNIERNLRYHNMINAHHTRCSSSSGALRLLLRWCAAHLLSGNVSLEVLECIVCKVYTDYESSSAVTGFIRCLGLISTFNFARSAFVVDPASYFSHDDHNSIRDVFNRVRAESEDSGPPFYAITPVDSDFIPSIALSPEPIVFSRLVKLASLSLNSLQTYLLQHETNLSWSKIFRTSATSFSNYSLLLRVNEHFVTNPTCSSRDHLCAFESFAKGLKICSRGPQALRKKLYKNIGRARVLHGWRPIDDLVAALKKRFGHLALFFYNQFTPEIICILWRPLAFNPEAFSAKSSEHKRPLELSGWAKDSLVVTNFEEVMAELKFVCKDLIVDIKVLDERWKQSKRMKTEQELEAKSTSEESSSSDDHDSD